MKGNIIITMNQNTTFTLNERWDDILYNLIDYPSVESIIKDFSQNFIAQLPLLEEGFIQKILLSGV